MNMFPPLCCKLKIKEIVAPTDNIHNMGIYEIIGDLIFSNKELYDVKLSVIKDIENIHLLVQYAKIRISVQMNEDNSFEIIKIFPI